MAGEIDFKIGQFLSLNGPVDLTLTSDDLESHIIMNVLSTSTINIYRLVTTWSLIVDVRTDRRTDIRTDRWTNIFSLIV